MVTASSELECTRTISRYDHLLFQNQPGKMEDLSVKWLDTSEGYVGSGPATTNPDLKQIQLVIIWN